MALNKYDSEKEKCVRCCALIDSLRKDRDNEESCDLVLLVENIKFRAHKSVLILCSDYFRAMFTGGFKESENGFVELPDISKGDFCWLLDFMYGAEMDFQNKSINQILSALNLADMFCLDKFSGECKKFVASWREYRSYEVALTLAKKLNLTEVQAELKSFVFRQLLPENIPINFEKLDMDTVPYDLLVEALKSFSAVGGILDIKPGELNTIPALVKKLQGILAWITSHPGMEMNRYLELLDMSGMEGLPNFQVGKAMLNVSSIYKDNSFDEAATAVNIKISKIADSVSATKLRLTLVNVKEFTVYLADYNYDDQRWKELSFHVGFYVRLVASDQDILYLIGKNELYTFDVKDKTLSEKRKLPLEDELFSCSKVFASNGILYMYGFNTQSKNVIIGIYNKSQDDFSRRELTRQYQVNNSVALTVKDNRIIFKNGCIFYRYDPKSNTLSQLYAINSGYGYILENDPKIALVKDDLLILVNNGLLVKNPSTYNYNLQNATKSALTYNYSDLCSTGEEYIIALRHHEFNGQIKLIRGDGNVFTDFAFLPSPKDFDKDGVHFILRQQK